MRGSASRRADPGRDEAHRWHCVVASAAGSGSSCMLLALVIVAVLAQNALKQYGLAGRSARRRRLRRGARSAAQAATVTPRNAIERDEARGSKTRSKQARERARSRKTRRAMRVVEDNAPSCRRHPAQSHRTPARSSAAMPDRYPHPIIAREGWPFLAHRAGRRGRAVVRRPGGSLARARVDRRRVHRCSSSAIRRATIPQPAECRAVARRRQGRRRSARRAIPTSIATRSRSACS